MDTQPQLEEQIRLLENKLNQALEALWREVATLEEIVRSSRDTT